MSDNIEAEKGKSNSASIPQLLMPHINRIIVVVGLVVVAYLGEQGHDGGFIKDVWNAAKTASPFAAMFAVMAWLKTDQERRDAQNQLYERTISFVESTNKQSTAVESMTMSIKKISEIIIKRERRR